MAKILNSDRSDSSPPGLILHIPHASTFIPDELRHRILLDDPTLNAELRVMTDWYTDELFQVSGLPVRRIVYGFSRLVCDPERFADDRQESMSKKGMGVIYERSSSGLKLRDTICPMAREKFLERYFRPHHQALEVAVTAALKTQGRVLILDCHSFPENPIPCDQDQSIPRPDICLGTDGFHTPVWLLAAAVCAFESAGLTVKVNVPYAGTMVPAGHFRIDPRVASLMIEVNRKLYLNEANAQRLAEFDSIKSFIGVAITAIAQTHQAMALGGPASA